MPFAENDGVKIYWEETGKGEPILLIMGLGWVSQMWHRTRNLLAKKYRVITFDNGAATGPPAPDPTPCQSPCRVGVPTNRHLPQCRRPSLRTSFACPRPEALTSRSGSRPRARRRRCVHRL